MKKIILPFLFMPLAAMAQVIAPPVAHVSVNKYCPIVKENWFHQPEQPAATPVAKGHTNPWIPANGYPLNLTTVGTTTYDLQTNGAIAKRLQLYSGGKLTYVWIKSDGSDPNYPSRFTGFNSFDGSSWGTQNSSAIEYDRSGWPNISAVTTGSGTYEILTSHYAAAGSNNYAGGLFWYANSGIGKTDFSKIIDNSTNRVLTQGLLWPRTASSGNYLYIVGTYQNDYKQKGVRNPVVYFKYDVDSNKFDVKNTVLPGYDSTRYGNGAADEYSIDARGKYVAILLGGATNDLALWKSEDYGETFTKTIIDSFGPAPYESRIDNVFDTTWTNDGSGTVSLDADGVAHVAYSPMRILNQTSGDSSYSYFADNKGITYWNDKDKQKITVGAMIDYDHDNTISVTNSNSNYQQAGYSGKNFCTYANIALDAQGHVFVVYSAPHETDVDLNPWAFRHVYCAAFDGTNWHAPQDIIQTWQEENAFPTVARDADDKLHIVVMQDVTPGMFSPGSSGTSQSVGKDTMRYAGVSTSDILNDKVGLINLSVDQKVVNNLYTVKNIFPNPAASQVNVMFNLKSSANVSLRLTDILGKDITTVDETRLPSGNNRLMMDVSNVPAGIYICNITAGGYTTSQRIVIER